MPFIVIASFGPVFHKLRLFQPVVIITKLYTVCMIPVEVGVKQSPPLSAW